MNEPLDIALTELRLIPRGSLAQTRFRDTYFGLRENSPVASRKSPTIHAPFETRRSL